MVSDRLKALRARCKAAGKSSCGPQATLESRLREEVKEPGKVYPSLSTQYLRAQCKAAGVSSANGNKRMLMDRLRKVEYDFEDDAPLLSLAPQCIAAARESELKRQRIAADKGASLAEVDSHSSPETIVSSSRGSCHAELEGNEDGDFRLDDVGEAGVPTKSSGSGRRLGGSARLA